MAKKNNDFLLKRKPGRLLRMSCLDAILCRMFPKSFIHTDHLYMLIALREKENLTTEIQVRL